MNCTRAALVSAIVVCLAGCQGLIGDTSSSKDDPANVPGPDIDTPEVTLMERLAASCASDAEPGGAYGGLRRLTSAEVVQTLTDLVGAATMTAVSGPVSSLPDDTLIGTPGLGSATYTRDHTDAVVRLIAAVAERVNSDRTTRLKVVGTCASSPSQMTEKCAKDFIARFAPKAYRRPLASDELEALLEGWKATTLAEDKLIVLIARILAAPDALFHNERGVDARPERAKLTPYEVASRIAYQTVGSMPDEALVASAAADELQTVEQVRSHVLRLLMTPRGRARLADFTRYWLKLDDVPVPSATASMRRGLDADELRVEALAEVSDFVAYTAIEDGGTLDDLFTSRSMMARTAGLAALYDSPAWDGTSAPPEAPNHQGLLGRVAYMLSTADLTSPIMRSIHFRERVLCAFMPQPDFSVINTRNDELGEISRLDHSTREAVTELTSVDACATCHASINPAGYVFENFGPLGEYRTEEVVYDEEAPELIVARHPIDTRVEDLKLGGGSEVAASSLADLVGFVTSSSAVDACVAQHLTEYTAMRSLKEGDYCGAYDVARVLAEGGSFVDAFAASIAQPSIFWRGR